MPENAIMVDKIKALQRSNPDAKQAWWTYCSKHLRGVKDPGRHESRILQEFLDAFAGAEEPELAVQAAYQAPRAPILRSAPAVPRAPPVSAEDMALFVKIGQRISPSWKNAWQAYCTAYGRSFKDPARYDAEFLTEFINYVGDVTAEHLQLAQVVNATYGAKRPYSASAGAPPGKRPRAAAAEGGEDTEEKMAMVDQIKALQRADPDQKAAWWAFCDEFKNGIKDPMRHDIDTLQHFLVLAGVLVYEESS